MGTRHLIIVYYKGEYRIAQYGQWDGYPSGQGIVVLDFIASPSNLTKFKLALDTPGRIFHPTKEQLAQFSRDEMTRVDPSHLTGAIRIVPPPTSGPPLWPSLHRDTGAKILQLVAEAEEPMPIVKEVEFVADTLFCEWVYVVDFDKEVFEIYSGEYEVGGPQGRFGKAEGVKEGEGPRGRGSWGLGALPDRGRLMGNLKDEEEEGDGGEE